MKQSMKSASSQQGVTLIVALVLLLIMTVVGLAATDSSKLQLLMSRNAQLQQGAYQLALSEINGQVDTYDNDITLLMDAITTLEVVDGGGAVTQQAGVLILSTVDIEMNDIASDENMEQVVELSFTGDGTPPSGFSVGSFVGKTFLVNSNANVGATGIGSSQSQGLNYAAPSGS